MYLFIYLLIYLSFLDPLYTGNRLTHLEKEKITQKKKKIKQRKQEEKMEGKKTQNKTKTKITA